MADAPPFWWHDPAPDAAELDAPAPIAAPCHLADVMAARTDDDVLDCGDVFAGAGEPAAALVAAGRCVVDAIAARRPFRAVLFQQGIDSTVASAWAARRRADHYAVEQFSYDSSIGVGKGPRLDAVRCTEIGAQRGCAEPGGSLCITCRGRRAFEPCEVATR